MVEEGSRFEPREHGHGVRPPRRGLIAHVGRLLRGEIGAGTAFWRDMIVFGSIVNVVAAFAALLALGFKANAIVATAIFFSPLPLNLLLLVGVWRAAARCEPAARTFYRSAAALWLVAATFI